MLKARYKGEAPLKYNRELSIRDGTITLKQKPGYIWTRSSAG